MGKMAELMGDMSDQSSPRDPKSRTVPLLEKRSSDYNLFRHGSISKWSEEELARHKANLQSQVESLKHDKKAPKTKIETMISIRNSDINLFRPRSSNKWAESEIKRAVDNMQNEMER